MKHEKALLRAIQFDARYVLYVLHTGIRISEKYYFAYTDNEFIRLKSLLKKSKKSTIQEIIDLDKINPEDRILLELKGSYDNI